MVWGVPNVGIYGIHGVSGYMTAAPERTPQNQPPQAEKLCSPDWQSQSRCRVDNTDAVVGFVGLDGARVRLGLGGGPGNHEAFGVRREKVHMGP